MVAKHIGSNWEFTQTFTGDAQQEYKLVISQSAFDDEHGVNPTASGTLTLRDRNFTTPITFQGSVSAVGANEASYTKATFSGTLTRHR